MLPPWMPLRIRMALAGLMTIALVVLFIVSTEQSWANLLLWFFPVIPLTLLAIHTKYCRGIANRRFRSGHCSACGYSRTGLPPKSVCPECGTAPTL